MLESRADQGIQVGHLQVRWNRLLQALPGITRAFNYFDRIGHAAVHSKYSAKIPQPYHPVDITLSSRIPNPVIRAQSRDLLFAGSSGAACAQRAPRLRV